MDLSDDGRLTEVEPKVSKITTANSASCVCVTTTVQPQSIKTSEFALAWHMPEVKFGLGGKIYSKSAIISLDYSNHFFRLKGGTPNGSINLH